MSGQIPKGKKGLCHSPNSVESSLLLLSKDHVDTRKWEAYKGLGGLDNGGSSVEPLTWYGAFKRRYAKKEYGNLVGYFRVECGWFMEELGNSFPKPSGKRQGSSY